MSDFGKLFPMILAGLALSVTVFAQESITPVTLNPYETLSCPYASVMIESVVQNLDADDTLIIVSYAGAGERRSVSLQRLRAIREFLTTYGKYRSADSIVDAVGTKVMPNGKVDFFVNGALRLTFSFRPRAPLRLQPCYEQRKTEKRPKPAPSKSRPSN